MSKWEESLAMLPVSSFGDTAVAVLCPTASRMQTELGQAIYLLTAYCLPPTAYHLLPAAYHLMGHES